MFVSEMSKEELNALSLAQFTGKIHLIERHDVAEIVAEQLMSYPALGFDTETRPSFTKGKVNRLALIQLATATDAYLFRMCKMSLPKTLIKLLAEPNILKIGAAIKNDFALLRRLTKVEPNGFVDLQDMMRNYHIKELGLAKIAGIVLGIRISKSQQLSNWENSTLTPAQQRYAATDAWVCYLIYEKLKQIKIEI